MDGTRRRRIATGAIMAGAALLTLVAPADLRAQEGEQVAQAEAAPAVEMDRLETYAVIHTEIAEVARQFYAELARTFEAQRKATLRTEMDEAIAAVREKHEMTPEEFKRITYLISVDQPTRDAFDAILNPEEAPPPS